MLESCSFRGHAAPAVLIGIVIAAACGSSTSSRPNDDTHGRLTEMSRVGGNAEMCSHRVPEKVCTHHHPELVADFKKAGDWCQPHGVPESQCFECHPDLTFEPLPELPADADVAVLSRAGEDVEIASNAVQGKVTIFDFYADWCAACRKVEGHVYARLARGDDLAYRKINVVSWETPVAKHYLSEVPTLPLIVVVDGKGQEVARMHGADLEALDRALEKAGAP